MRGPNMLPKSRPRAPVHASTIITTMLILALLPLVSQSNIFHGEQRFIQKWGPGVEYAPQHIPEGQNLTWANGTYDLGDNLTIKDGAHLKIQNATVKISSGSSGLTHLRVAPGGLLSIINSTLSSNGTNTWMIESWGEVLIQNSELLDMGGLTNISAQGAQFIGGNLSAENVSVRGGKGTGIVLDHANATINRSTIEVPGDGIHCSSSQVEIDNLDVLDAVVAVASMDCTIGLNQVTLDGQNSTGIFVEGGSFDAKNISISGGLAGAILSKTQAKIENMVIIGSQDIGLGIDTSTLLKWSNIDVSGTKGDAIVLDNLSGPFLGPSLEDKWDNNDGYDLTVSGNWMPQATHDDLKVSLEGWLIASSSDISFDGLELEVGSNLVGTAGLFVGGDRNMKLTNGSISAISGTDWNLNVNSSGKIILENMILIDPGQLEGDPAFSGLNMYAGEMRMTDVVVASQYGYTLQVHSGASVFVNGGEFIGGEGIVIDGGKLNLSKSKIISSYNVGFMAIDAEVEIDGLNITDPAGGGAFISNPSRASITNLEVNNSDKWGVWVEDGAEVYAENWKIHSSAAEGLIIRDSSLTPAPFNSSQGAPKGVDIFNTTKDGVYCERSIFTPHLSLDKGFDNGINATGCVFSSVEASRHLGWDAVLRQSTLQFTGDTSQPGLLGRMIRFDSWNINLIDASGKSVNGPFILNLSTNMNQEKWITIGDGNTSTNAEFITEIDDGRGNTSVLEWIEYAGGNGNISTQRISVDASEKGSRSITLLTVATDPSNPFSSLGGAASAGWFIFGIAIGLAAILGLLFLIVKGADEKEEMEALGELKNTLEKIPKSTNQSTTEEPEGDIA